MATIACGDDLATVLLHPRATVGVLAADADWLAMVDERVGKVFIPGTAERMITRRVA